MILQLNMFRLFSYGFRYKPNEHTHTEYIEGNIVSNIYESSISHTIAGAYKLCQNWKESQESRNKNVIKSVDSSKHGLRIVWNAQYKLALHWFDFSIYFFFNYLSFNKECKQRFAMQFFFVSISCSFDRLIEQNDI